MAKTNDWAVQKKVGGVWTADGNLDRPNSDFSLRKMSTQIKTKLIDGDNAYISPATKYTDEPLSFAWYWDDGTMKTKVEGYITSQNDLKITDHDSNQYIGRFISISSNWIVGDSTDYYDIQATFEMMPDLA